MPDIPSSAIISGLVGGLLTPLIMYWWKRVAPPAETSDFDAMGIDAQHARNNRIDVVGTVLSFCGLLTASPFYFGPMKTNSFWPLGMGVGMMVIFPLTFFWIATRRGGIARWREFWRLDELKWGVSLRRFYAPLAMLGVVSLVRMLSGN
jgi:hypothetical protein